MSGYVFGEFVESDLDAVWEYIARDDADAADRWMGRPLAEILARKR